MHYTADYLLGRSFTDRFRKQDFTITRRNQFGILRRHWNDKSKDWISTPELRAEVNSGRIVEAAVTPIYHRALVDEED